MCPLTHWGSTYDPKDTCCHLFHHCRRIAFDKAYARQNAHGESVTPGHLLLDAVNQQIVTPFGGGAQPVATCGDREDQREGVP